MLAKEAIAQAKALVKEFYNDEEVSGIRLEEVEFDEPNDSWLVTLGILRPAVERRSDFLKQALGDDAPLKRTYKVVKIPNEPRLVPSMKIRELRLDE